MILDLFTAVTSQTNDPNGLQALLTNNPPKVLTIAGVDPSGGAGVLADIKTFGALGAYGCGVVTGLTAQNTHGINAIQIPSAEFVAAQIDSIFNDIDIQAVKTGMLGNVQNVQTVAEKIATYNQTNLVLDPVMLAKSGDALLDKKARHMLREALIPLSRILTPNLPEAGALLNEREPETRREMVRACERLHKLLHQEDNHWILLKGGHLASDDLIDLLYNGDSMIEIHASRYKTRHTHGTGCALAAAITALIPQHTDIPSAVKSAHQWLQKAIQHAEALQISRTPTKGHGPINHAHALYRSIEPTTDI